MSRIALLLLAVSAANGFQSSATPPAISGADMAQTIREKGLDASECYRIRDLSFVKDDIKLYLNDGYLIFSKPVLGQRLSAVFTTDVEGGDGEAIVIPPTRSERQSTGIPELKLRYSIKGVAPAVRLSGTVVQSGAGDDFALDTPVEVQFAKGPSQTIWVRTAGDERNFAANLRQVPVRVLIPDEILKK